MKPDNQQEKIEVNVEYGNTSLQFYIPEQNIPAFDKNLTELSQKLNGEQA